MLGIFDSGSGGLTVLREIQRLAPQADVLYFGDFANVPYGEKKPEELGALATVIIEKLLAEGATDIVSACNSVSASVAQPLISLLGRKRFQMIEMVAPTVDALVTHRGTKKIALAATPATVQSHMYQDAFARADVSIAAYACSGLALAIESEEIEAIEEVVAQVATQCSADDIEVLALCCTQYPLVKDIFEKYMPQVEIFIPSIAVAEQVIENLTTNGTGQMRFLLSKDSVFFRSLVERYFGDAQYTVEVL